MKANMGKFDRTLRLLVAVAIGALYFMQVISGTVAIVLLVVATIFILTSLISFCPLYYPFGINTCKTRKA
ncbi:DUF2892 domain-containing protein [Mucilaginibacter puniceus]